MAESAFEVDEGAASNLVDAGAYVRRPPDKGLRFEAAVAEAFVACLGDVRPAFVTVELGEVVSLATARGREVAVVEQC